MKTINTLVFATLTTFALSVPYAIADDAHHPDQPKAATAAPVAPASVDKSVQTMKENAKKMQTQLDRIGRAKNPQERQRLLHEHMQTMRENMMMGMGMGMDMDMDMDMMQMMMEQITKSQAQPAQAK